MNSEIRNSNSEISNHDELAYLDRIIQRIENYLKATNMSQAELGKQCGMKPSAMSKVMKKKQILTIPMIYRFAKVMKVDPSELTTSGKSPMDSALTVRFNSKDVVPFVSSESHFVTDPDMYQFRGMEGIYYFYCRPTISTEKNRFLKGIFTIKKISDSSGSRCETILQLKTGQKNLETQEDIVKEYHGFLTISEPTGSCFTMMYSPKYSDFCCLNWNFLYLNDVKLSSRIVACIASSAGESNSRTPIMLKAILTRKEFTDEDLQIMCGQLFMNSSEITITKDDFYREVAPVLLDSAKLKAEIPENVTDNKIEMEKAIDELLNKIPGVDHLMHICQREEYYTWTESDIHNRRLPESDSVINLMRKNSINLPYTKISHKADSILHNYVMQLPNDRLY